MLWYLKRRRFVIYAGLKVDCWNGFAPTVGATATRSITFLVPLSWFKTLKNYPFGYFSPKPTGANKAMPEKTNIVQVCVKQFAICLMGIK